MARAISNYRQTRVTLTEEAGGMLSVRIWVKPVTDEWKHGHVVFHHRWRAAQTPPDLPSALEEIADLLVTVAATMR